MYDTEVEDNNSYCNQYQQSLLSVQIKTYSKVEKIRDLSREWTQKDSPYRKTMVVWCKHIAGYVLVWLVEGDFLMKEHDKE